LDAAQVLIRRGASGDAEALADLAARTFLEAYREETAEADLLAYIEAHHGVVREAADLADPVVAIGLAEADGRLVGYVDVRGDEPPPLELGGRRPILLHRLYVDASAQGLGIGKSLFDWYVAEARRLGGDVLWLTVWERNRRAIAIYERWGFVDVGSVAFHVGVDEQRDRVMVRPLE
jgi:GNAT superfamily N-acetyltransferase